MGYNLNIKRREPETPITLDEWKECINTDTELTYSDFIETLNPMTNEMIRIDAEGMGIWSTTFNNEEYKITFSYQTGRRGNYITVRYVDDFQIPKMKQIANMLNAIVVGDEGEEY